MIHRLWVKDYGYIAIFYWAFKRVIILNLSNPFWKQRKLFPYIFIAMSLLGALPAIYFAGSHKRRTQGLEFFNCPKIIYTVTGMNHTLFLSSIFTNFVWKSTKDHCSFIMSGLEETLTETISGLFEMFSINIINNSGVGDNTMRHPSPTSTKPWFSLQVNSFQNL